MKKQSLSISIPEPCHEKWSEMTPSDKGRHCQSCQKTVVDFTRMPKVKIAEYISENQGKLCGRFNSEQLNVELISPKPTKSWLKYAAIILGLVPTIGYGQEVTNKANPEPSHISNGLKIGEFVKEEIPKTGRINVNLSTEQIQSKKVTGIVVDDATGDPILFGTVALFNDDVLITGVDTDIDGKFAIEVPEGYSIEASYTGYQPIKINARDIVANKNLTMRLKENVLMGGAMILGMYVPNKTEEDSTEVHHENNIETEIVTQREDEKEEEEIMHYLFPAVEIISYKPPMPDCYWVGSVARCVGVEEENWIQRQWRKFKNLVKSSHEEAVENREVSQLQPIENTAIQIESTATEEIVTIEKPKIKSERTDINIKVFPNPTSGYVNITLPNHVTDFNLNISNMNNELVYSKAYFKNPKTLDLSPLVPGAYIISIIHQHELIYSEMVIKI